MTYSLVRLLTCLLGFTRLSDKLTDELTEKLFILKPESPLLDGTHGFYRRGTHLYYVFGLIFLFSFCFFFNWTNALLICFLFHNSCKERFRGIIDKKPVTYLLFFIGKLWFQKYLRSPRSNYIFEIRIFQWKRWDMLRVTCWHFHLISPYWRCSFSQTILMLP